MNEKTIAESLKDEKSEVITGEVELSLADRIKKFEQSQDKILAELKIKMNITLNFPDFNRVPVELQLAIAVMEKYNKEFVFQYEDLTEKK